MDELTKQGVESLEDPSQLFDIIETLGEGSYGSVYKARHTQTSEIIALKVIDVEAGEEEELADVVKEIQILRACQDANIVRYVGSYIGGGKLYISMEYCGGGSVSDLVDVVPFDEVVIATLLHGTLKGLAYLHNEKRIHRDIKGGNILLTDEGSVKLADFGVSVQLHNTISKRDTFIGTPFWMAPEVIKGLRYDGRADIWSTGITAIEMAEGAPPLAGMHPFQALFQIPKSESPTLKEPERWSPEFNDFLKQCLLKDPEQRPSAVALLTHAFFAAKGPQATGPAKSKALLVDFIARGKAAGAQLAMEEEQRVPADEGDQATMRPADTFGAEPGKAHDSLSSGSSMGVTGTFIFKDGANSTGSRSNTMKVGGSPRGSNESGPTGTMIVHKDTPSPEPEPEAESEPDYGTMVVKLVSAEDEQKPGRLSKDFVDPRQATIQESKQEPVTQGPGQTGGSGSGSPAPAQHSDSQPAPHPPAKTQQAHGHVLGAVADAAESIAAGPTDKDASARGWRLADLGDRGAYTRIVQRGWKFVNDNPKLAVGATLTVGVAMLAVYWGWHGSSPEELKDAHHAVEETGKR